MLVELIGFVSRITRICQLELIGFANWIRHFLPGIAAVFRDFIEIKMKVRGNISKTLSLNSEQVQVNVDSPFKAKVNNSNIYIS